MELTRGLRTRPLNEVMNGDRGVLDLRPGEWQVSIVPAGGKEAVFGPVGFDFEGAFTCLIFPVASTDGETVTVLVENFRLNGGGDVDDDEADNDDEEDEDDAGNDD